MSSSTIAAPPENALVNATIVSIDTTGPNEPVALSLFPAPMKRPVAFNEPLGQVTVSGD
jgi:hypothetical protein